MSKDIEYIHKTVNHSKNYKNRIVHTLKALKVYGDYSIKKLFSKISKTSGFLSSYLSKQE